MNDPTTSSRPSRVLLVTASVGAGHLSAARAIAAGLGQLPSGLHVETVDALALTPRWFRACYVGGFTLGMTRLPRIYGLGYILTNHPQRPGRTRGERIRLWRELPDEADYQPPSADRDAAAGIIDAAPAGYRAKSAIVRQNA